MTAVQRLAIADAERRGRDIYDFDEAAWGSTDALLAALPDPSRAGVKGWIVKREPGGAMAIYYGLRNDKPYKIFVAHVQGRKVLASHLMADSEDGALTAIEQRMIAARAMAAAPQNLAKIGYRPCERAPANTVVLEPLTPNGDVSVYILTPQIANDRYPLGGHYRIDVAPDGSITNSRAFTNTCLAMAAQPPQGATPAGMFVTHVLDRQPTEIHIWISLVANLPVYVGTIPSNEMWAVQNGGARLIQTLSSPPSP